MDFGKLSIVIIASKYKYAICLLLSFAILIPILFRTTFEPDLYIHLSLGRDVLNSQNIFVDSHSYTDHGKELTTLPWLFEVTVFLFYRIAGEIGLEVMLGLLWLLAMVGAIHFSIRRKLPIFLTVFYLCIMCFVFTFSNTLRAHTLALALYGFFIAFIYECRTQWTWRQVALLTVVLVAINNWHQSSVIYYLVVGAALAELFIKAIPNGGRQVLQLLPKAAVVIGSGFLTPTFFHPVWNYTVIDKIWSQVVIEMSPGSFEHHSNVSLSMFLIFALCTFYCLYRKRVFEVLLFIGFGAQAFLHSRMILMDLIILTPVALDVLNDLYQQSFNWNIRKNVRVALYFAVGVIPFMALLGVVNVLSIPNDPDAIKKQAPVGLESEGKSLNLKGNVFHRYDNGGWLMFYTPDLKIHIDGRGHLLYSGKHLETYQTFGFATNYEWALNQFQRQNVEYIATGFALADNYVRHALYSGSYKVQWLSEYFILLANKSPSFETLSAIAFRPACFDRLKDVNIETDLLQAEKLFGKDSVTYRTVAIVKHLRGLSSSEEMRKYSEENSEMFNHSDLLRRVLSYALSKKGDLKEAVALLLTLNHSLPIDTVQLLKLADELKDPDLTTAVLNAAPPGEWFYPDELNLIISSIAQVPSSHKAQLETWPKLNSYEGWLANTSRKNFQFANLCP